MNDKRHYDAPLKCQDCGRFIPLDGSARIELLTPDSHLSVEEWLVLCKACNEKEST